MDVSQDIGAAEVVEDAAQGARVEAGDKTWPSVAAYNQAWEHPDLLVLRQGLVQLRVAPSLATAVDADHVELGISDMAEV